MQCQSIVDRSCFQRNNFKIALLNKVYVPSFETRYILNRTQIISCEYIFWLIDVNFGVYFEDPINKICWKMLKIRQKGFLKIKLYDIITNKHIFRFLPLNLKMTFFAHFQILGSLECQGCVVMAKNVKKCQNHCNLLRGQ